MCSSLLSNQNSEEFEKENLLTNRPNCVHVIVEDEDDCRFWNDLLCYSMPNLVFDINPYQNGKNLTKGKHRLLNDVTRYGKWYIACVDSDYDYLLDDISPYYQSLQCPFVIQTQVYSFENYVCNPSTLQKVCFQAVLCNSTYNFVTFINKLSKLLYPILTWSLYLQSIGDTNSFKIGSDWGNILPCAEGLDKKTEQELLDKVDSLVTQKINNLKQNHPNEQANVESFGISLRSKFDLKPSNAYMYVQGHALFSYVLNVLIKPTCEDLRRTRINFIKQNCINPNQLQDSLNHYKTRCHDYETSLMDNFEYKYNNPYILAIINKIQNVLA